jgi:glycerate-2-kinase
MGKVTNDLMEMINSAIKSVNAEVLVKNVVRRNGNNLEILGEAINLLQYERLFVVGGGKAAAAMALAIEDILSDRITNGLVNVKYGHSEKLAIIRVNEASHPLPDEKGMDGAKHILELVSQAGGNDLVIVLLSGGGSALLPMPQKGITLDDKKRTTEHLLMCGAKIDEINIIRKHISKIKGGRLAEAAYPAKVLTLIISDVVGDKIDAIASGPTAPDNSTFFDCMEIIRKYDLSSKLPKSVAKYIINGTKGIECETVKGNSPIFKNVKNIVIGRNKTALNSAAKKAEELGYDVNVITAELQNNVEEAAKNYAELIKSYLKKADKENRKYCFIAGGETTLDVKGKGKGGRNTHLALKVLNYLPNMKGYAFCAIGTDGTDGYTEAAGAFITADTYNKSIDMNLNIEEYLMNYDSYNFFKKTNNLIITGPTKTNVMDLHIVLISSDF